MKLLLFNPIQPPFRIEICNHWPRSAWLTNCHALRMTQTVAVRLRCAAGASGLPLPSSQRQWQRLSSLHPLLLERTRRVCDELLQKKEWTKRRRAKSVWFVGGFMYLYTIWYNRYGTKSAGYEQNNVICPPRLLLFMKHFMYLCTKVHLWSQTPSFLV